MSLLRASVYVAEPIPTLIPDKSGPSGVWSPISCTLIYSDSEAVLVDTPISVRQTRLLINWIEEVTPGRKLSYIYITHGHGDHWFGIPLLLARWPEAVPVATEAQIYQPFTFAQPLPKDGKFSLAGRWTMEAIECGHTDTHNTTVLWVPDLRLVAGGDVVYGGCHQMLAFANTKELRTEWIRAIERIEALNPFYVVPGHKQAGEIDGVWHLATTKKYIQDFGQLWSANPQTPQEVFDAMSKMYPDRFNLSALRLSVQGTFAAFKAGKAQ